MIQITTGFDSLLRTATHGTINHPTIKGVPLDNTSLNTAEISYTAPPASVTDTFSYKVTDGFAMSEPHVVQIKVGNDVGGNDGGKELSNSEPDCTKSKSACSTSSGDKPPPHMSDSSKSSGSDKSKG